MATSLTIYDVFNAGSVDPNKACAGSFNSLSEAQDLFHKLNEPDHEVWIRARSPSLGRNEVIQSKKNAPRRMCAIV